MIRIAHLLDHSAGWEQRVGICQLIDRLPRDDFMSTVAAIDPAAVKSLRFSSTPIEVIPSLPYFTALSGPSLARFAARRQIDLVHAWGSRAAQAARALSQTPLVVHLFDPLEAARHVKMLRVIAHRARFAAVCSSDIVRRRLIEGGLPAELAVTIRPGVDFSLINRSKRGPLRSELGLSRDDFVVILPEPITMAGGQFEAAQAVVQLQQIDPDVRLLVAGNSHTAHRIARVARTFPRNGAVVAPSPCYPFEQLLAVSDALLVTPRGDTSTTAIAWAMAASVVVIGTAVYAVAEMISNKLNGLLYRHIRGRTMLSSIASCLQDRESQRKVVETARGQAYEVFGLRRCIEQHAQVYENVLAGKPAAEGIADSAVAG